MSKYILWSSLYLVSCRCNGLIVGTRISDILINGKVFLLLERRKSCKCDSRDNCKAT